MIPELADLLRKSIDETLEEKIAIAFSGGLDSSLIAHIANASSEIDLFTCGVKGSEDLQYAEQVAALFHRPLFAHEFSEQEILQIYEKCFAIVPGDLLKVELLVPVYQLAVMAKENAHKAILFGSASEELFIGYERYYTYAKEGKDLNRILQEEFRTLKGREIAWIKKVCYKFGIEARFPFYNNKLADFVFSVPLNRRMEDYKLKKGLLREAGKLLGLNEIALQRKKRAMQYGSGVHKILLKHAKELNGIK